MPGAFLLRSVRRAPPTLVRFWRGEEGGAIALTLFMFVLMVMIGGMAVDFMRFEQSRTRIQQTMDRSLIAAASLKQTRPADAVVNDYFQKAGLQSSLVDVTWQSTLSSRRVQGTAATDVKTIFMKMFGIDDLSASVGGSAEESVSNIEISLVLDISGSMREGNQIGKLRVAAKEFFATVLDGDAATTTSINIVPYAGMVNVGPLLFTRYGGVRVQDQSSCIELSGADYQTVAEPSSAHDQVPHFMKWTIDKATMNWGWCPTDNSAILIAQNDPAKLNAFVDGIRLHDGTGTQTGVKYGLMLLNPATRATFGALSGNQVPSQFANRPLDWSITPGSDVKKYMVVMTDGAITEQVRPKHTGLVDPDPDALDNETVPNATTRKNPKTGKNETVMVEVEDPDTKDGIDYDNWNGVKELDNQPSGNGQTTLSNAAINVGNFKKQCNLAKAKGVIVFTIAFNANATAQGQMRDCASDPAMFFSVDQSDNQIRDAFAVIARNIRQLRLTQ